MGKATLGTRTVFANLAYIRITPWAESGEGTSAKFAPGALTYDVTEVVADTTTVEQAENESNALDHEFKQTPLYENITLGEKTFACESIDLQNEVLKGLFGWTIDEDGNAYAPVAYKELYAVVELGFNSTDDVIVLPKVLLNSRPVIASMKTDASRANINGTCYTAYVNGEETDMAVIKDGKKEDDGASIVAMITEKKA
jgi:hypothetical protein